LGRTAPNPEVFTPLSAQEKIPRHRPPRGFRSPTEFSRARPPQHHAADSSRGVLSPTTFAVTWNPSPRAYHTRYVALSGFLNLLALYCSRRLPAIFKPVTSLGFRPFRASSPKASRNRLSTLNAFLLLPPPNRDPQGAPTRKRTSFKALSRLRSAPPRGTD